MLNKGNWNGKQIVSEDWVAEMIKQRTTYKEINKNVPSFRETGVNYGYGYMWWLFEDMPDTRFEGSYMASGAMGQAIAIIPELDMVIAYKTKAAYRRRNSRQTRLDLVTKAVLMYEK